MANCKFCAQPAGLLRGHHAECQQRHDAGARQILALMAGASRFLSPVQELSEQTGRIAAESFIPPVEQRQLLVQGWSNSVAGFLHDGPISGEVEGRLVALQRGLGLSQQELDQKGAYSQLVKSAVIRDVLNGIVPKRFSADGLPLNLQKEEWVVWAFQGVHYLEDRVRRQYVGGSQGVSFRIAKGVYYRVGAFHGQPIDRTQRVQADTGILALTGKHAYFVGPRKSLRVPYAKIVSFQPFSDGFGLTRDAATAKPQIFVTGDGWFSYNLITNLAHLAVAR